VNENPCPNRRGNRCKCYRKTLKGASKWAREEWEYYKDHDSHRGYALHIFLKGGYWRVRWYKR
jgi:hypothetical protein